MPDRKKGKYDMKLFRNILYVVESTADQSSAIERTVMLATAHQAKLSVIEVIPPVTDDDREAVTAFHTKALESLVAPYHHRLSIQSHVLPGTMFLEVIRFVLRDGYDLVIKPAQNPGFIKRLFGSDDKHLLRKCPCPVWIMKPPEKLRYDRILAAVDFDPLNPSEAEYALNRSILEPAALLSLSDNASLHLVHAWEAYAERVMKELGYIPRERVAAHDRSQYLLHKKGLDHIKEMLRDIIGADAYAQLSVSCHLPKGPAQKMIAEMAGDLQADLVVMGTVARTGVPGFIIGNTAETIVDQLDCSLLAVKPPEFETPVKLIE
jgi:nucleotide-binding universal stress UspA family protein